jgi:hypothetical protein
VSSGNHTTRSSRKRSPIPRQLSLSPMRLFARAIEDPLNMPVQRSHEPNYREKFILDFGQMDSTMLQPIGRTGFLK